MVEIGPESGVGRKNDWALRCHLMSPLPLPRGASRGVGGQVKAGGGLGAPEQPPPLLSPLRSEVATSTLRTSSPLPPYLLVLQRLCTAGLFFSTTLAEGFLFVSLLSLAPLPRGLDGDPPHHGWPKMENAEQRKMEASLLCVALDLGAFSLAGA